MYVCVDVTDSGLARHDKANNPGTLEACALFLLWPPCSGISML